MTHTPPDPPNSTAPLADDMLNGARPIAEFIGTNERRVYHLAETKQIPVFRLGGRLTARKSTLRAWIERQEAQAMSGAAA